MSRKLSDRMEAWIESKQVLWGVFFASIAETTVVPIPIEVVLIPIMLANCDKLWRIAASALAGCLVGASIGYLIGMGAFEGIGEPVIEMMGMEDEFEEYRGRIEENGFWYVLVIAVTPVPFQIAYLGAGVVQMPFYQFLAAIIIGRGSRYFGLALLVYVLGKAAGPWLERNKYRLALWVTGIFIGGYIIYKLLPI